MTDMGNQSKKTEGMHDVEQRIDRDADRCAYSNGTTERIKVYANIVDGKTVCICHAGKKGCAKKCPREIVTRDKYYGWEKTFRRNKYGE